MPSSQEEQRRAARQVLRGSESFFFGACYAKFTVGLRVPGSSAANRLYTGTHAVWVVENTRT